MSTKKKNDSDYKQLERQFNALADCVDKLDNNNAREICDLQTRVRRLEEEKISSSHNKQDIDDVTDSLFPLVIKCILIFGIIAGSLAVLGSVIKDILSLFI